MTQCCILKDIMYCNLKDIVYVEQIGVFGKSIKQSRIGAHNLIV